MVTLTDEFMMTKTAPRLGLCSLRVWIAAAICAICCCSCGSAVNRGAEFYTQGRYIDAALVFEHAEARLESYGDAERARYGLYRGATLLALGYAEGARHWLDYGSALALHSLSAGERSAFFAALWPRTVKAEPPPSRRRLVTWPAPAHVNLTPAAPAARRLVFTPRVSAP